MSYDEGYRRGKADGYELAKYVLPDQHFMKGFMIGVLVGILITIFTYLAL